ncbi:MAG: glycosyltransferase family 4 protein [Acidobacteria bacterium]|nr:glycosyltransferase family 4 protein [Acidobacteriota bacterium]MYH23137.1 glycosyltransferase family 4 protein [Acidobacteriota bacterium]
MRILYVHANFSTPQGSWSTRAYDFARHWIARGHQVTIVTGAYDRSDLRPTGLMWTGAVDGIAVRALNVRFSNRDRFARRVVTYLALGAFAAWQAARRPYDVALVSCGPVTLGAAAVVARRVRRRTTVVEVRDLFSDGLAQLGIVRNPAALAGLRRLEDVSYRSAHAVVALSDTMGERLRERHRLRSLAVVPNTANLELFGRPQARPAALTGGGAHFLYTGTLGRANDCGQILRAARLLRAWSRSEIHIHLIGDGSERPALQKEAAHAGLDNVHFVPPIPKETLGGWLGAATAMVLTLKPLPVFDTVSPNKLFDALAAGLPVIQTTGGWIRGVLRDHHCGITVDPHRPQALAEAMVALSDDRPRRDRMGRNARRIAAAAYGTERLADRMLATLAAARCREPIDSPRNHHDHCRGSEGEQGGES